MLTTILAFIILLSLLVLVHELGHFTAAKLAGIRVEEFGLGLPPRVWGKRIGETIYSINLLPIGGFVRLTGEEGGEKGGEEGGESELASTTPLQGESPPAALSGGVPQDPHSFASQSNLIKSTVLTAGVAMNFLLGVFLLGVVVFYLGVPRIEGGFQVQTVVEGSPAAQAGVEEGDLIVQYSEKEGDCLKLNVQKDGCFSAQVEQTDKFIEFIKKNAGSEVTLFVFRGDSTEQLEVVTITPRKDPPAGEGALGIIFVPAPRLTYEQVTLAQVPGAAFSESFKLAGLIFVGVKDTVVNLVTRGIVPKDVAGPVGIAKITGDVAREGLFPTLQFAALLSINLGVINILPFPALDGGRLLFVLIEALTGRQVRAKYQRFVHTIGIAILLTLMLLITFYDILRFL